MLTLRPHQNPAGVTAAERHPHVVQAHADRIAADEALVQNLELGALNKPHFQQAPLKFGAGQTAGRACLLPHAGDHAAKAAPGCGQRNQAGVDIRRGVQGVPFGTRQFRERLSISEKSRPPQA